MAALAAWIGNLVASLASVFGVFLTKRVAIITAALAVITTITTAMWAGMEALVTSIAVAVPESVAIGASWLVPTNIEECFAAIVSGHVARFLYDLEMNAIMTRVQ